MLLQKAPAVPCGAVVYRTETRTGPRACKTSPSPYTSKLARLLAPLVFMR